MKKNFWIKNFRNKMYTYTKNACGCIKCLWSSLLMKISKHVSCRIFSMIYHVPNIKLSQSFRSLKTPHIPLCMIVYTRIAVSGRKRAKLFPLKSWKTNDALKSHIRISNTPNICRAQFIILIIISKLSRLDADAWNVHIEISHVE